MLYSKDKVGPKMTPVFLPTPVRFDLFQAPPNAGPILDDINSKIDAQDKPSNKSFFDKFMTVLLDSFQKLSLWNS